MERNKQEHKLNETDISISTYEATLISNLLQIALYNITMDDETRKRVRVFRWKLNRAALAITKRYLESLHQVPE